MHSSVLYCASMMMGYTKPSCEGSGESTQREDQPIPFELGRGIMTDSQLQPFFFFGLSVNPSLCS